MEWTLRSDFNALLRSLHWCKLLFKIFRATSNENCHLSRPLTMLLYSFLALTISTRAVFTLSRPSCIPFSPVPKLWMNNWVNKKITEEKYLYLSILLLSDTLKSMCFEGQLGGEEWLQYFCILTEIPRYRCRCPTQYQRRLNEYQHLLYHVWFLVSLMVKIHRHPSWISEWVSIQVRVYHK